MWLKEPFSSELGTDSSSSREGYRTEPPKVFWGGKNQTRELKIFKRITRPLCKKGTKWAPPACTGSLLRFDRNLVEIKRLKQPSFHLG